MAREEEWPLRGRGRVGERETIYDNSVVNQEAKVSPFEQETSRIFNFLQFEYQKRKLIPLTDLFLFLQYLPSGSIPDSQCRRVSK